MFEQSFAKLVCRGKHYRYIVTVRYLLQVARNVMYIGHHFWLARWVERVVPLFVCPLDFLEQRLDGSRHERTGGTVGLQSVHLITKVTLHCI